MILNAMISRENWQRNKKEIEREKIKASIQGERKFFLSLFHNSIDI
jgi:hypothetical protein